MRILSKLLQQNRATRILLLLAIHYSLFTICSSCQKEKITLQFIQLPSGTNHDLNDILFLNDSVGFVCGGLRYDKGDVLKTTDGGFTWQDQSTPDMIKAIYHLDFLSSDTGFCCGYDGKIFRTFDGLTWSYYQNNRYRPLRSLFMIDAGNGYVCGGDGYKKGYWAATTDGGNSWNGDTSLVEYRDLYFSNESNGVMCGYGIILYTNDSGATWNYSNAKQDFFVAMSFVNAETGYVIGYTGSIWKTDDGGKNWERLRNSNSLFQPQMYFNCVEFRNADVGYIAGEHGCLLKTADGGNHWEKIKDTPDVDWKGISLVSNGGFLCGTGGAIYRFLDQ